MSVVNVKRQHAHTQPDPRTPVVLSVVIANMIIDIFTIGSDSSIHLIDVNNAYVR